MYDGRADSLPSVPPGRSLEACCVVPRPSGGMRYMVGFAVHVLHLSSTGAETKRTPG